MGALIGWQNWIDDPGVSVNHTGTVFGDLGPSNVLTRSISEVWRGQLTTGASIRLRFDLGAIRDDLSLFILAAPRDGVLPGTGSTARFVASAIAEDGEEAANQFATNPFHVDTGLWVVRLATPISARWVHWRVLGVAGDTYWNVGRAFAGPSLVTSRGIAPGWQRGAADTGAAARSPIVGTRYGLHGAKVRRLSFDLPGLTAAEAASLRAAAAYAGRSGQVFAAPFADTTAAALGVLGTFVAPPTPRLRPGTMDRWQASIAVDEEL